MNILRSISYSVLVIALLACGKQKSDIENEELASLIADMHISEVALKRHKGVIQDSLKDVFLEKLELIHKMDRDKIKFEVELLMEDRTRQSDVYSLVINRLQQLEKELKNKKDPKEKEEN